MPRPRIKRLLLLLLAYTVGGAIINVAVAWGCYFLPIKTSPYYADAQHPEDRELWFKHVPKGARLYLLDGDGGSLSKVKFMNGSLWNGHGFNGWCFGAGIRLPDGQGCQFQVQRRIFGLPLRSMFLEMWNDRYPSTQDGIWIGERPFPIKPLWPGFAINTIFYAAILWLLFAGLGFVRRRIRTRRGQCPACAYPVGASDVCTECGKPVRGRSVELTA